MQEKIHAIIYYSAKKKLITDLYMKIKKACPPLSLHGQLLWREFFYCAATKNENFDKMLGNPICVQIPWDRNPEALAKWANVSLKKKIFFFFDVICEDEELKFIQISFK